MTNHLLFFFKRTISLAVYYAEKSLEENRIFICVAFFSDLSSCINVSKILHLFWQTKNSENSHEVKEFHILT